MEYALIQPKLLGNRTICSVGTTDAVTYAFSAACHVDIHTIASWQSNTSGEEAATAADEETSARYRWLCGIKNS